MTMKRGGGRGRRVLQAGKSLAKLHPGARSGIEAAEGLLSLRGRKAVAVSKAPKRRRTRGMYLRKGRLFMGFSQKEVKAAMRRVFGGRKGGKR